MTEAAFWDKAARRYAKRPIDDIPAYEATLDRTRAFLHQDDRILEIGCGTGGTARLLAPAVAHITATDISAEMIAIAKERADSDQHHISFQQASVTAPPPDQPYDAICAFNILHLVADLPGVLTHLKGSVKAGGFVISKTPCLGEMNVGIRILVKVMRSVGKAPYVNALTIDALEQAFVDAGLELVETGHFRDKKNNRFIVARHPN